jgi:uncharacterized protein YutE (UPF0331/DUF86 family)
MSNATTEFDVLQEMISDLEAEGYEVFLHPNRPILPGFLGDYAPDLIARRGDRNLAIEVIQKSQESVRKAKRLASLFSGRDNWDFKVVWITPTGRARLVQPQTRSTIRKRISEVRDLAENGHFGPALLLAWATLEATGRMLAASQFQRPQTPGRLVQVLASEGYLTPDEADHLRSLSDKRNKLIHGELQTRITRSEVTRFADVLDTLADMIGK